MEINKIYNENCLDTMGEMEDCFVDLVVTSPPYDNLRNYNGFVYGCFDFELIAHSLFRILKHGGILVWVVGDSTINGSESLTSFKQVIFFVEQCGFNLHDTMIYEKETLPLTHNRYEQHFEYMFVLSKGKPKTFNRIMVRTLHNGQTKKGAQKSASIQEKNSKQGGKKDKVIIINENKTKGNIWYYATGMGNSTTDEIAYQHTAIFPEKLAAEHIYSWSNEGELVYDPFMGSGTTAKMAHLQKRNYIGSEISKEYCELAEKRLLPYLQQQKLNF